MDETGQLYERSDSSEIDESIKGFLWNCKNIIGDWCAWNYS